MLFASIGICYTAVFVFLHGPVATGESIFTISTIGASLNLRIDEMSALFLIIISFIGLCATLYSIEYLSFYKKESLIRFSPFLLLFITGMVGVVCVSDMFFFFVFWEFMTLASYLLVIFEREKKVNLKAGFKYFLLTHIGTACMFFAEIVLWTQSKSFDFNELRGVFETYLSSNLGIVHIVLLLFFIGFATKAAIFPFGIWLPDAHPAAPSGVSAILSGVMIKMGIYGLLRVFISLCPISHTTYTWGIIIAVFGTVSLFVGTLTALIQEDSKRLLAFHSIGQVGYIFLSLGMGIAFLRVSPVISAVALTAGVYHLLNHACFKSLLFLNAGSILYRTGTRDLNKIGGLSKLMPITAATALVASLSISGMPFFNGFISKWLIYQVTIMGGISNPLFIILGLFAFFISVVTLASFIKFMTTSFWGKTPDSLKSLTIKEVPLTMQIPQVVLAVLCVVLGILPVVVIPIIYTSIGSLGLSGYLPKLSALFRGSYLGLNTNLGEGIASTFNPLYILFAVFICSILSFLIFKMGKSEVKQVYSWYCGEKHTGEEVRYKAHSFYTPFKQLFRVRLGKRWSESLYLTNISWPKIKVPGFIKNVLQIDQWFYYPLVNAAMKIFDKLSASHVGVPQVYTLWLIIGMVLAIAVLFALS
jgi:hydrogenase-4 component B